MKIRSHVRSLTTLCLGLAGISAASAQEFFSTEHPDRLFTIGVRAGFNTSNRTITSSSLPGLYHHESWGTGFDFGATVGINIRDYLAIQPGVFFEARYGRNVIMGDLTSESGAPYEYAVAAKRDSYNLTIPVMAQFSFNLSDAIRWQVEAGPYLQILFSSKVKPREEFSADPSQAPDILPSRASGADFGLKFGTGLLFDRHWYLGIHYLAGLTNAWKERQMGAGISQSYGGHAKAWTFTVGYDF